MKFLSKPNIARDFLLSASVASIIKFFNSAETNTLAEKISGSLAVGATTGLSLQFFGVVLGAAIGHTVLGQQNDSVRRWLLGSSMPLILGLTGAFAGYKASSHLVNEYLYNNSPQSRTYSATP